VTAGVRRRLTAILARFGKIRLLVAGDLVADEFIYGRIDRVSREAPVLILSYDSTEVVPGGAGNAANNALALGARVSVAGVVGRDAAGSRLLRVLGERADVAGVIRAAGFVTPVKTRILAGGVHSAKQQVVRIDRAGTPVPRRVLTAIEKTLAAGLRRADAVILSDYGAGLITPDLWARALEAARLKRPPIVLVDSRYNLMQYRQVTACTPNESEAEAALGVRIGEDARALEHAGRTLQSRLQCPAVLITRGSRGMALFEPGRPTDHIPIVGSDQIADVTGAGDTVIATFTLALAAGASFGDAARLANHAGSIVVMKRGTATVTRDELAASLAASGA
jgi:rfaE bifunctional protein kinase chain/domain